MLFRSVILTFSIGILVQHTVASKNIQVLVICDDVITKLYGTHTALKRYVGVFFGAVNLMFRDVEPKIKLEVIVVVQTRNDRPPGINDLVVIDQEAVDATKSVPKLKEYMKTHDRRENADIVLFMSRRRVFYSSTSNGESSKQGGICTEDNIAISEDDGRFFSGVQDAAYRIALLLGASGTGKCNLKEVDRGTNQERLVLGECGKRNIKEHLPTVKGSCFEKDYVSSMPDEKRLPTQFVNKAEFCRTVLPQHQSDANVCDERSTQVVIPGNNECKILCCGGPAQSVSVRANFQFDGENCGAEGMSKICVAGNCVRQS